MTSQRPASRSPQSGKLPRTVVGLGLVSLLTDASSEAIFPLLPAFLSGLGASGGFIGLVEGSADLVANLLKLWVGLLADRRRRLKPLVLAGYGLSTFARPLVAFATAPWHVLLVRISDRVGKGVRTSPRDALIAAATDPTIRARAYGFHRAMDHAGAAIGTLLSSGLLWLMGASRSAPASLPQMRTVFAWAAIPGLLALVALAMTPEALREPPAPSARSDAPVPPLLKRALLAVTLFAVANATDAFLLVWLLRLGGAPALAPLLWLTLHVVKASLATHGGRLADRFGRRNALIGGWLVYAITWGSVGLASQVWMLFALTAIYGISHGLVEGAERALIAELSGGRKGRGFGLYNLGVGLAALASSTAFGVVLDHFGAPVAFAGSALFAVLAAAVLFWLVPAHPGEQAEAA